jgi:CheY-like chemotaxis protein
VTEAPASLLVVDDDPINRMVLCRELERQGHHVATADDGAAGLEALLPCFFGRLRAPPWHP